MIAAPAKVIITPRSRIEVRPVRILIPAVSAVVAATSVPAGYRIVDETMMHVTAELLYDCEKCHILTVYSDMETATRCVFCNPDT